jgi:hypothetical protein
MISIHLFWNHVELSNKRFGSFRYGGTTDDGTESGYGFMFGFFGVSLGRETISG